jgi:acyl dehydratase
MADAKYFEDFSVGQKFISGSFMLDEAMIKAFARDYDPQPFHMDEAAAQDSFFGTLVASGWQTAALTMRLLVQSGLGVVNGVIGAGGQINWPKPVYPGDTLHAESEIIEMRISESKPDRGIVKARVTTFNQNNEAVQILVASLIVSARAK